MELACEKPRAWLGSPNGAKGGRPVAGESPSSALRILAKGFFMSNSIPISEAAAIIGSAMFLDVRKPHAHTDSGLSIPGSTWRHPFDALNWSSTLRNGPFIAYCVHGHEVSQSVAGFLRDCGHDCRFLEGGFEAWREAGLPVAGIGGTNG